MAFKQTLQNAVHDPRIQRVGVVAAMLLYAVSPVPDFWITQLNYIALYSLVILGLVLLTGIGGLTSFGQAAFVGLGAYTSAYLSVRWGWSPWLTLWAGLALTAVCALLLGGLTLRMSGHYLPLATMAWGLALYYLMGNLDALGKYDGLLGVPALRLGPLDISQGRWFFVLAWGVVLLSAFALLNLMDSRTGRAIRALRASTLLAEAMGVDTLQHKVGIFLIAALLASVSGWLFAHYQHNVNPSPFGLKMGIEYLFMTVLGGAGAVWGAISGAVMTKLLEDELQVLLPQLMGTSGSFEVIVFGIVLVLVLKYLPDGVWSLVARWLPAPARHQDWADAWALPQRAKPEATETVLEVHALRKQFGGLTAVQNVGFAIGAGQIVGLIGPNGAGKSTTFNLITGVLAPTSGEVRFRGQSLSGLSARAIASRGVSRTFQHVKMIPELSVLENVALGAHMRGQASALSSMLRTDRADERRLLREAARQLERIGMADQMHTLAGNLAMGPQRLMEIARALCSDPALLLLDEPAAGLRHKEKQALAGVLRQLRADGMSILLVEHDMDLVMDVSDHIVVMEFGTKLMEGTPQAVQQSEAVRAAYLGVAHGEEVFA